jgi:hypothetical protein
MMNWTMEIKSGLSMLMAMFILLVSAVVVGFMLKVIFVLLKFGWNLW